MPKGNDLHLIGKRRYSANQISGSDQTGMTPSTTLQLFLVAVAFGLNVDEHEDLDAEVTLEAPGPRAERCYPELGCFGLTHPWFTLDRPFTRLPDSPATIDTTFYLSTRNNFGNWRRKMKVWPEVNLEGLDWDRRRWTVLIAHGFRGNAMTSWVRLLESALLTTRDLNIISCDWSKGSSGLNYIRAASNARVVGAEVARLIGYLLEHKLASVDRVHLIGQSLGAHLLSYVSSYIKNISRLTALDPAQPGFEGAHPDVRVDPTDAHFVDVIHTNGDHFIASLGFGMIKPVGHVDFFVNGGKRQPGCWLNKGIIISQLSSITQSVADKISCSHQKAWEYYIEALKSNNCSFWGRLMTTAEDYYLNDEYHSEKDDQPCTLSTCQEMGCYTKFYPARGTFNVKTNENPPYCIPEPMTDYMMRYNMFGMSKKRLQTDNFEGI